MATTTSAHSIHTCILCGNRWNPQYVSFKGCPYCKGTGNVTLRISVQEEDRLKRVRKAQLRKRIEATYEVPGGKLPAWNVFWAFVYHDAHARQILEIDLAYCVAHGILKRKSAGSHLDSKIMGAINWIARHTTDYLLKKRNCRGYS